MLPRQDETIWTIDRLLGALAVPLFYLVMRKRFADPTAAVGGAAVLAVTPLLARFSASDTPYIPLCAALLGAVVAYDSFAESASVRRWPSRLACSPPRSSFGRTRRG